MIFLKNIQGYREVHSYFTRKRRSLWPPFLRLYFVEG